MAGYPEGVPDYTRYTINAYGTIGSNWKPPYTTIVKYDLNGDPGIKWRIGFGDDPDLATRGITGTGTPQMRNSIIVTEAGGVTRKMVQQVRDSLQTAKIRILGVILNKIVESAGSYYNYYSYYKYQEQDEENTGAISRIRDKFRRSGSAGT